MHVLFVNTLYAPHDVGGAERSVRAMTEALAAAGDRATVVTLHAAPTPNTDIVNGVRVHYLPHRNLFFPFGNPTLPDWTQHAPAKLAWHTLDSLNPWAAHDVGRVLDRAQPDLVHTNSLSGFSPLVWRVAGARGLPVVHTLRDYHLLCHRATMHNEAGPCDGVCWHCTPFAWLRHRYDAAVDAVVGISDFILQQHRAYGGFAATPLRRVIPNPYAPPRNARRADPPTSEGPLRAGFLGRVVPAKGLDVLLDAACQLPRGTVEVHVGGTGPEAYERTLRRTYRDAPVAFHGYVDAAAFLPTLDVLVVPSRWHEPLGRVVFEAYAHGVPVLGSARGGIPELIVPGRTGYVFNPDAPDALTRHLRVLADDPARLRTMQQEARAKAKAYRPAVILQAYRDVYTQVLAYEPPTAPRTSRHSSTRRARPAS
jgi:glycosyltransferase involved in cell wall biosynthesis